MPDAPAMTPLALVKKLNASLQVARYAYYVQDKPIMTDAEYDATEKELKDVVAANPQLAVLATVLTEVGSDLVANSLAQPVKHKSPMLSLENAYSDEDLDRWLEKVPEGATFGIEPKVDGLSLNIRYSGWNLWLATTRGNGTAGEDVTPAALTIADIPHTLDKTMFPHDLEVRGEVFLTRQQFAAINAEQAAAGKDLYKTSRNLASGSLKLKDPKEVAKRRLSFQPWQVIGIGLNEWLPPVALPSGKWVNGEDGRQKWEGDPSFPPKMEEYPQGLEHTLALTWFAQWTHTRQCQVMRVWRREDLKAEVQRAWSLVDGLWADIIGDVDGLVVKVEEGSIRDALGTTGRTPNWAIAVKRQSMTAITRLIGVEWTVGRTGILTPTGVVEPVVLGGATVQRANLCNMTRIRSLGLKLGSRVEILRSGDVIPQIVRRVDLLEDAENSAFQES